MDILQEIIATKRRRLEELPKQVSSSVQHKSQASGRNRHALKTALIDGSRINIIAEFKRRSPSKGVILEGADAASIAHEYQAAGAAAISVLTEEDYFSGSLDDLRAVRQAVSLPILRKDFVIDEAQIEESVVAGADAVLLIVAALSDVELSRFRHLAEDDFGLDALIEVHTVGELRRAVDAGATLIGVNNRDLRTFNVSLETSEQLASEAPRDTVLISESGLSSAQDVERLRRAGFKGFLIGESLMRADSPRDALHALISSSKK